MKNRIAKSFGWIVLSGFLTGSMARATDCFNSEASHFAGGAALASATTYVVYTYVPKVKHPALTGFAVAVAGALIGEIPLDKDAHFSALDAIAGSAGGALGAFAVNKWYITPRVETRKEETTYAVVATHKF